MYEMIRRVLSQEVKLSQRKPINLHLHVYQNRRDSVDLRAFILLKLFWAEVQSKDNGLSAALI
jgi:hypothetical protein